MRPTATRFVRCSHFARPIEPQPKKLCRSPGQGGSTGVDNFRTRRPVCICGEAETEDEQVVRCAFPSVITVSTVLRRLHPITTTATSFIYSTYTYKPVTGRRWMHEVYL